jgi:hypothetical protein
LAGQLERLFADLPRLDEAVQVDTVNQDALEPRHRDRTQPPVADHVSDRERAHAEVLAGLSDAQEAAVAARTAGVMNLGAGTALMVARGCR